MIMIKVCTNKKMMIIRRREGAQQQQEGEGEEQIRNTVAIESQKPNSDLDTNDSMGSLSFFLFPRWILSWCT